MIDILISVTSIQLNVSVTTPIQVNVSVDQYAPIITNNTSNIDYGLVLAYAIAL